MAISLADLAAAQRAYSDARLQAIQSSQKGADAATVTQLQHQALLDFLQKRAALLTDARSRALDQFEAEITRCQQKIGEVQQLLREDNPAGAAPAAAVASSDAAPAAKTAAPKTRKKAVKG